MQSGAKSHIRARTRSTSCSSRRENQLGSHKRPEKQLVRRSASSGREVRRSKKLATHRSLHPSPELLTSDATNYYEVNLTKRPRASKHNTPQTLKFTTHSNWATPVAKPQRPAHMSKDSTMSSLISNAIAIVSSRRRAKGTKDESLDDPPLVLSDLNSTAFSAMSAETTQFIVDQLVKTDANIANLAKKVDQLALTQGKSKNEQEHDTDVSSSELHKALLDNDALRAQINSMTRAFTRDTAETRKRIAATCSLSSTLRSALEKSTIHSMELENKLAVKEAQLQRLQWINKNLELKLSAASSHSDIIRPSSAYPSRLKKIALANDTPEKRRRCSSARQEPRAKCQPATPAIVISQSLLESLDNTPEQIDCVQKHNINGNRRSSSSTYKHNVHSMTSPVLQDVFSVDSVKHFSPPNTPQFHTKTKPLPELGKCTTTSQKKIRTTSISSQKSAKVSSSSKRSSLYKATPPQNTRQSALESYAQTALTNELSLWKDRCTKKDLLVKSLERQTNELKVLLKEKETQLVSVQQQTMNVMAEKKLLVDELTRIKIEVGTCETVAIPSVDMIPKHTKMIPDTHNNEKLVRDKLISLEADLSAKDALISELMAQLQNMKSINEQPPSSEAVLSPSHVSILNSNAGARTSGSSPSPLTLTSVLQFADNQSPANNTAELETEMYKVSANSPSSSLPQPVKAPQTRAEKRDIKRLVKQEKKQEKLMKRAASNSSATTGSKKGSRAGSRSKSAFSQCGGGSGSNTEFNEEIEYVIDKSKAVNAIATAGDLAPTFTNNTSQNLPLTKE